jgi:A/G-specific adenine glycosylase
MHWPAPWSSDCSVSEASTMTALLTHTDWQELRRWHVQHGRHSLPWRQNRTHWRILVAETLLRRTRADAVRGVFEDLIVRFPDPESVVLDPDDWRLQVQSLGLGIRATTFVKTCLELTRPQHSLGTMTKSELQRLPGVGHYVATAVRCFAGSDTDIVVDSNTIRVASRLAGTAVTQAAHRSSKVQRLVRSLSPASTIGNAEDNFALLDLGALVCRPRQPECTACVLRQICASARVDTESQATGSTAILDREAPIT